jgi:hypothetical protein
MIKDLRSSLALALTAPFIVWYIEPLALDYRHRK